MAVGSADGATVAVGAMVESAVGVCVGPDVPCGIGEGEGDNVVAVDAAAAVVDVAAAAVVVAVGDGCSSDSWPPQLAARTANTSAETRTDLLK